MNFGPGTEVCMYHMIFIHVLITCNIESFGRKSCHMTGILTAEERKPQNGLNGSYSLVYVCSYDTPYIHLYHIHNRALHSSLAKLAKSNPLQLSSMAALQVFHDNLDPILIYCPTKMHGLTLSWHPFPRNRTTSSVGSWHSASWITDPAPLLIRVIFYSWPLAEPSSLRG